MNFTEAEKYLLSRRGLGIKFGLENMKRALRALDSPETVLKTVLVAGSKGKGSVCSYLDSIFREAGLEVGLYTSPHLVSVRERIRVGGAPIGARRFAGLVTHLKERLEGRRIPLTYFEWLTLLAIFDFADRGVELALLEIGMGGRLDAANAVQPVLSVITGIEREHTDYLGSRLGEIAREKAGVIRRGASLVAGIQRPTARRVVARVAGERGVKPRWVHRETASTITSHSFRGLTLDLTTPEGRYLALKSKMLGRHQAHNMSLAVLSSEELRRLGFPVRKGEIRRGLSLAQWPGRCEYRPGRPAFLLDGAHTPDSARALAETLDELFPKRRRILLFGALRDKKIRPLATALFPGAASVILVRPPEERGAAPEEMLTRVPPALRDRCTGTDSIARGISKAVEEARSNGLIVVAGSLFLVGEVRGRLFSRTP